MVEGGCVMIAAITALAVAALYRWPWLVRRLYWTLHRRLGWKDRQTAERLQRVQESAYSHRLPRRQNSESAD